MVRNKNLMLVLAMFAALNFSCTKAARGGIIGGVAGGALGAGIGAAIGGKKGAAIGAAVGAAAGGTTGAVVGHYMDKKEKRLKEKVKSAQIERVGDELIVKFDAGLLFTTGSDALAAASQEGLTDFAEVLQEFPDTDLVIEGHTDSDGKEGYNKSLSDKRAVSVASYLAQQGIVQPRMNSMGYGESKPVADNATAAGKQLNRRVEVKITANQALKDADAENAAK